ncbi:MAG: T9SS type A sorting domain-containing protein [Candidatus Marinimicrobia bacterium]|nr:T9SS type A sorting domain-containing protein [Candidatus Neomarinimicrobiota bacterium]
MKTLYKVFIFLSISVLFAQTATPPALGSGAESDPYQIATLENLHWISTDSANWGKHYIQTDDIDASSSSSLGYLPIGVSSDSCFYGSYDGQGYSLDFIMIISSANLLYSGLFGYTHNATIKNIHIRFQNLIGRHYVGGLVGKDSMSTIINCSVKGYISGRIAGGIVSMACSTTIRDSYTDLMGLTGINAFVSSITSGGIVAYSKDSHISNCYSLGIHMVQSFYSGSSYNYGGLIGESINTIVKNCYRAGITDISLSEDEGIAGGLIGTNQGSVIQNSFWDMDTTDLAASAGGTGKTTTEMKMQSTYTDSSWNFIDTWVIDPEYNDGYPFLKWQRDGVGIKEDPVPHEVALMQNYPNPFNPITTINYTIPSESKVKLSIYDISGQLVETLIDDFYQAGQYEVKWNASNYSSGIYISRLENGNSTYSRKMVLIK